MATAHPPIDTDSPLLQTGLADDRFHLTDYMGDRDYPGHRAQKEEAEHYVGAVVDALGPAGGLRAGPQAVGVEQRPDLAVSPGRPLQRELRGGLLDPVTRGRRPWARAGSLRANGRRAAMPCRAMQAGQLAEPADRQGPP